MPSQPNPASTRDKIIAVLALIGALAGIVLLDTVARRKAKTLGMDAKTVSMLGGVAAVAVPYVVRAVRRSPQLRKREPAAA